MGDDHFNSDSNEQARASDSSVQRRPSDSSDANPGTDGKPGQSLEANGEVAPNSNDQLQRGEELEAELVHHVRDEVEQQLTSITRIAPLPHPSELQGYEDIQSGLAERIVAMAEGSASAANMATQSNAAVNEALADSIREEAKAAKRGQWMIFTLVILLLIVTVIFGLAGNTPFAAGMGILLSIGGIRLYLRPTSGMLWRPGAPEENAES